MITTRLLYTSLLFCSAALVSAQNGTTTSTNSTSSLPGVDFSPVLYELDPYFNITSVPTTREVDWVISPALGAPDGYSRQMFVVNGQFPGPTLEANEGDNIIVHVYNNLTNGQTIHYHGIMQNGTQWMDGVPGISQCPIPPGGNFTYNFTVNNQFGTYWWHSHFGNQYADGIIGAMVVHSPNDPLKKGVDYDEERILMVHDWLHAQSDDVVNGLLSPQGYKGTFVAPQPDSILLNGQGAANCSALPAGTPCNPPHPAEINVPVNKRIRIRILNLGTHAMLRVSFDKHPFNIVEADDCPIDGPKQVHEVPVAVAQRYSVIIDTNQGKAGDLFWIRAILPVPCIALSHPQSGLAILRYVDDGYKMSIQPPSKQLPTTQPWSDLANPLTAPCVDLNENLMKPLIKENAPTTILQNHIMTSLFGVFVNVDGQSFHGFGWNNITYQNQINNPLLAEVEQGKPINNSLIASATFNNIGGGDIILNNADPNISHPYHLHGRSFFLVARGNGVLNAESYKNVTVNTVNPLRRDVLQIPQQTWAILRLITDVPGVWPLHCHIGWHLAVGKLAAIVIQPQTIEHFDRPSDWSELCAGTNPSAFGPARRSLPPRENRSRIIGSHRLN